MSEGVHEQFWKDGFVIIRGVFSREEALDLRARALRHPPLADLLSQPGLRPLLLDQRILQSVRTLLGPQVVYFQDSSVAVGDTPAGLHKDCVDRDDARGPDWAGRYPIVRVGVYLQDHVGLPGGLDLQRGSHNVPGLRGGEHVYADSQLGDVVIWNLRTNHSGSAVMLTRGNRPLDPARLGTRLLRRVPLGLLKRHPQTRVAVFMTFGAPGEHLERFIAYLKTREYAVAGWQASPLTDEMRTLAESAGVQVRDMLREMRDHPPPYVSRAHRPLAY